MEYLNGSHGGLIGPQKSPCIHSKNNIGSLVISPGNNLITNFS